MYTSLMRIGRVKVVYNKTVDTYFCEEFIFCDFASAHPFVTLKKVKFSVTNCTSNFMSKDEFVVIPDEETSSYS